MAPDEPSETTAADPGAPAEEAPGVFGNLPTTRPGARSPRRDEAPGAKADRVSTAAGRPAPETDAPPEPQRPEPPTSASQDGGIEDVAWAGVAAAAEAATIGVRLATRALEAMRDAVDRR